MNFQIKSTISLLAVGSLFATLCSADIERVLESLTDLTPKSSWDYFVFTQQWPSTVCSEWKSRSKKNKCTFPEGLDSWTIHGVWPSDESGPSPQFCNSSWIFNSTLVEDLLTNMTLHWPNIYAGTSQDEFWAHEWSKHGTCATADRLILNEFGYFNAGLVLANKYNVTESLLAAGIVPEESKTYTLHQISAAVTSKYGVVPMVTCYRDKKNDRYLVEEIRMCVDLTLKLMDCEESQEESCPGQYDIHYLPIELVGTQGNEYEDYKNYKEEGDHEIEEDEHKTGNAYRWEL